MDTGLEFYPKYSYDQLVRMGDLYYAGKCNSWQKSKYEFIRDTLFSELKTIAPNSKCNLSAAAYIHAAIGAAIHELNKVEKIILVQMRANAQTAHNHMVNYGLTKD